jgi:ABC-type transport system involved in multi-copper enzyme maturation permease subunit
MWTGLKAAHVALVARFWARFVLRTGGGVVYMVVLVLAGLWVAQAFITPVERLLQSPIGREVLQRYNGDVGRLMREASQVEEIRSVVKWISGGDDVQADYLLHHNPALLSAVFLILLLMYPFLVCFGGFNQTAGDIHSRGLRYLLLRTERPNIFFGRFLGALGFTCIYVAGVITVIVLYVGLKLRAYPTGDLIGWSAQGYAALLLLTLPYLAMCAWISALVDSPFGSLVLCLAFAALPLLLAFTLSNTLHVEYDALTRALPWGWKYDLLSGDPARRLQAIGVMLAYTALFLFLGVRRMHRRDL